MSVMKKNWILPLEVPTSKIVALGFWREKLLNWGETWVLPHMFFDSNDNWVKTFKARREGGFLSVRDSLFVDCFKWVIDEENSEKDPETGKIVGQGYLTKMSIVPDFWFFWDIVFSLYLAADPELFQDESLMAQDLLRCIEEDGFDPTHWKNMMFENWRWIKDVAEGKKRLCFLRQPMSVTAAATAALKLAISGQEEPLTPRQKFQLTFMVSFETAKIWEDSFGGTTGMTRDQRKMIKKITKKYPDKAGQAMTEEQEKLIEEFFSPPPPEPVKE